MEHYVYTTAPLLAATAALAAAFLLALIRLLSGPSLPDRVIALDLMAFTVIAFVALFAVYTGQPALLNVALALALVAFLGTVAFARFLERMYRGTREREHHA